ncbi:uncharacterized protein C3orf38 homolog [Uloborus diversus]|uniref:uncharacterized protein C3orf38 homolog n=1 Tax=Uloborus diversus TaxID=327109 RepID=UPI0024098E55|nr:uncharacterized protein C3orf38 homolog [Uloborus diversus]
MLTAQEKCGLTDILSCLSEEDVFSILETVTKRMIKAKNRQEAVEKILFCTETPSDLLRRQKITKKTLLNYLIKVKVPVNPEGGKTSFVRNCLQLWESNETFKESDYDDVDMQDEIPKPSDESIITQMGLEFTKWFFNILNSLKQFGPEHFWPDCVFWVLLKSPAYVKEFSLSNSNAVVAFLSSLVLIDKLYFDANSAPNGVLSQQEQHGMVKVVVSGVLHQYSNCIGIFDIAFGLVKVPETGSWKIKCLQMKMIVSVSVNETQPIMPSLDMCQTV